MKQDKYPKDLIVTIEDFKSSGWHEAISDSGDFGLQSYYESFIRAAQNVAEEDGAKGKVLLLLADVCSMSLKPKSIHNPFKPMIEYAGGGCSATPEDFEKPDIMFFESILPEINDYRLKARLADLLWLINQPKNIQHAHMAIAAYQQFPLDFGSLVREGKEAWERAIRLALMLGSGAQDNIQLIWDTLFQTLNGLDSIDKAYGIFLSNLLEVIPLEDGKYKIIADKLEKFSQDLKKNKNFSLSRSYCEKSIAWHKLSKSCHDVWRLTVEIAELFVLEALCRTEGDNPSNIAAGHFLECAIHEYRKIPGEERPNHNVEERLKELHKQMSTVNKLATGEMSVIKTESIDLSQIAERSKKLIRGKSFPKVLFALANSTSDFSVDKLQSDTEKNLKENSIHALFPSSHMTSDGRVAARTLGLNLNDPESDESQQVIWGEMVKAYGILIGITAQGIIIPALEALNLEHRITERKILEVCNLSPIIPYNREELWAKGLYLGFEHDFLGSTHMLTPQVEHFVRTLMKHKGIKTTTLDSKGIETENGLSTLVGHAEISEVLDNSLIFEFKALLTDSIGSNLRNKIAHGLLEADEGQSTYTIYFWWLCLRLVVNSTIADEN